MGKCSIRWVLAGVSKCYRPDYNNHRVK